jgi:hypothetical protein
MNDSVNSVQGNTRGRQEKATVNRSEATGLWSANAYNIAIPLGIVIVGDTIARMDLPVYWHYILGIALIWTGSKLNLDSISAEGKLWDWPKYIKALGWIVLAVSLLGSGIGKWMEYSVTKMDNGAYCAIKSNKSTELCQALAAEEAPTKQPRVFTSSKVPDSRPCPNWNESGVGCTEVTFYSGKQPYVTSHMGRCLIADTYILSKRAVGKDRHYKPTLTDAERGQGYPVVRQIYRVAKGSSFTLVKADGVMQETVCPK